MDMNPSPLLLWGPRVKLPHTGARPALLSHRLAAPQCPPLYGLAVPLGPLPSDTCPHSLPVLPGLTLGSGHFSSQRPGYVPRYLAPGTGHGVLPEAELFRPCRLVSQVCYNQASQTQGFPNQGNVFPHSPETRSLTSRCPQGDVSFWKTEGEDLSFPFPRSRSCRHFSVSLAL